jgi:hypothetical protein
MQPNAMMSRQSVADYRATALSSGRYDLLALEYTYPLTIFIQGEMLVAAQPEDVIKFYAGFHTAMTEEGLNSLVGKVTAEDLPRNGRFRIWTNWSAVCQAGTLRQIAATVCYCRILSSVVVTEMVEFSRLTLPLAFV